MIRELGRRLVRSAQLLLIGALPALLIGLGVMRYMLNHFFFHPPYLLDTGLLSQLSYHDGLTLPTNKIAVNYVDSYYDVYVSPLTSAFSLLSYIVPIKRLEWFSIIQGAVYVPIGLATYLVASHLERASALRRLPITFVAAIAFSFSGIVLWMVGYPHFEAAIPGLTCMMLGALVTGRNRMAWACLVLAACVRQDGGFHCATALVPLLFLSWRGFALSPTRRKLVIMIAAAIGMSVSGMLLQKLFFHPISQISNVYLGKPLYSHVTIDLLANRASHFRSANQLIYYPFLATCLIAVLRRDARYLLGWASVLPWFAFSFAAVSDVKAGFFAYGAGPFIVAIFWVYLYGAHLAPVTRRLRAGVLEAAFALVCLASTLGAHRANPEATHEILHDMKALRYKDRALVHSFVDNIHRQRASLGRFYVDGAVATLAMEELAPDQIMRPGLTGVDAYIFHNESLESSTILGDLIANNIDVCAHVHDTKLMICSREQLPASMFDGLAVDMIPASLLFTAPSNVLFAERGKQSVRANTRGVVFSTAGLLGGWLGVLPRGTYEWTMTLSPDEPLELDGEELARLEVVQGNAMVAFTTVQRGAHEIKLRFYANGDPQPLAYRFGSRAATPLTITTSQLRRVSN